MIQPTQRRARRPAALLLVLVTLAVALPAASLAVAAADDAATVFQRFVDARNRGDVAGTVALVTDDIRQVGGPFCTQTNPCIGAAAFRTDLETQYIPLHAQLTIVGVPQVSGTTVQARVETRSDPVRAAGLERTISTVTAEVRDGKIASYITVADASDAQTAQYLAFQRSQQAPPATAPPTTAALSALSAPTALPQTGHADTTNVGLGMLLVMALLAMIAGITLRQRTR